MQTFMNSCIGNKEAEICHKVSQFEKGEMIFDDDDECYAKDEILGCSVLCKRFEYLGHPTMCIWDMQSYNIEGVQGALRLDEQLEVKMEVSALDGTKWEQNGKLWRHLDASWVRNW
ncbi:hypothetical protein POM88_012557 [Heracleum sosnowskyi]|uniref:Uncharacterized protein n=1 Tax=Heracleum sosnowskyi TaxID=360622 RepID=A0AAD8IXM0_9APIA|nr:hypothetical protein POM88_012557 [Heracleum sosnowskyi]